MPGVVPDDLISTLNPFFRNSVVLIAQSLLESDTATSEVADIPQYYLNLQLTGLIRTDNAQEYDNYYIQFNGDTGNNYDYATAYLGGITINSIGRGAAHIRLGRCEGANSTDATTFSPVDVLIPAYSNFATRKSVTTGVGFGRGDVSANADVVLTISAGTWRDTSAVESIVIGPVTGSNLVAKTRLCLWGIR
jgi:hypothetical protein